MVGETMSDNGGIIRREMRFSGSVQGVGFRYRAKHAAESCGVSGWVENEWDGTVFMEAQGTERQILEMIRLIKNGRYIRIDNIDSRDIPLEEDSRGFHIR